MSIILLIFTASLIIAVITLIFLFNSKSSKKRIILGAILLILIFISFFLISPYILLYKGYERKVVYLNDWWVSFEVRPSYHGNKFISYYQSPYLVLLNLTSKSKEQEKVYFELLDFGELKDNKKNSFYQKDELDKKLYTRGFNKIEKTDNFLKDNKFFSYSASISNVESSHNPIYIDMKIDFRGKKHALNLVIPPNKNKTSIESRSMDAIMGI